MLTANAFTITSFGKCPIDVDELLNQEPRRGKAPAGHRPPLPLSVETNAQTHTTQNARTPKQTRNGNA